MNMNISSLNLFLAMAPQPSATGQQPDPKAQLISTLGMFAIMGVMFYFVLIRPQQKRAKEQAKLIEAIKPGDKIITNSGIVGVVVSIKENIVTIRSADAKMDVLKSAVGQALGRDGEVSNTKS